MSEIKLNDILQLSKEEIKKYKLHIAVVNEEGSQPMDVFIRDKKEWQGWNEYKGKRDEWNRQYIFTLIHDYHRCDKYIFGGIFEVNERLNDQYVITLTNKFSSLIGRLVVNYHKSDRNVRLIFENYIDNLIVSEILEKEYSGVSFPGYDKINIDFTSLEFIMKNEKQDWKISLVNVKGVYLIVDKKNGKKYVGSAYGDNGIWARWACYIGTGHGGNDELVELIKENGIDYARENFKFSILEIYTMKTDTESIIRRESFWKEVLLTKTKFGYNKN